MPIIRKVKVLQGKAKIEAERMKLDPDDLVIVSGSSIEKIKGDPVSYLLKRSSDKVEKIKAIIEKHEITCGEDIWQRDSISENALTIIEEICIIVGYYEEGAR